MAATTFRAAHLADAAPCVDAGAIGSERLSFRPVDETAQVLVATSSRTTGALICAVAGATRAAAWTPPDRLVETLESGTFAEIELVVAEAAGQDELEALAAWRLGARPALVAFIPAHRVDLRHAAEKLGFDGCLSSPVDALEVAGLTKAFARRDGDAASSESETAQSAVVDMRALNDLAGLGGKDFVHDIVAQFIDDATTLLHSLHDAMARGDAASFRDQAHALRSCAANVGASSVYSRCLALRGIERKELLEQGARHLQRLESEVAGARDALESFVASA